MVHVCTLVFFTRVEFQKEIDATKKTALGGFATPPSSIACGSSSIPATPIAVREARPPAKTAACAAPPVAARLPHIKPYVRKRPAKGLVSGQPVAGRATNL